MFTREFLCFFLLAAAVAVCEGGKREGENEQLVAAKLDAQNEQALWMSPGSEKTDTRTADWKGPRNGMTAARLVHGRHYHRQYKAISDKLERELGSQEPAKNMAKLAEMYEEARQSGAVSSAHVEALEQLLSMNQISDTNKCNRDTYAVLYKNDRATGARTHKTHEKLPILRHLDTVVHHFAWQHALDCYPKYPRQFQVLRDGLLDSRTRNCVHAFTKPLIEKSARNIMALTNKQVAAVAWEALDKLARNDPDHKFLGQVVDEKRGKLVVKTEQIQKLVKKYLVEPCQKYSEVVGPDVYAPYNYDRQMLDEKDQKRLNALNSRELLMEFSDGWLAYRLCKTLVTNREASLPIFLTRHINEHKP